MTNGSFDKKDIFVWALVFIGGYFVFKYTCPEPRKSLEAGAIEMKEVQPEYRTPIAPPTANEAELLNNPVADNAFTALTAYVLAYNANEPQSELDKLNAEIGHEMGMKIMRRRTDNKLVVYDLNDNPILENNG